MLLSIREVLDRRDLLYMITWREIKVRYKQTVMGMLWAVLMPLVIVCAGLVVRVALAKVSETPLAWSDLTSVTVKAAPWAFFVSALRFGTNSLVANTDLITKVYLPRVIFPLAAVFSQLVDFLIAGAVVSLFLVVVRAGFSVQRFWLPVLLASLIVLAVAFAIVLSAAISFPRRKVHRRSLPDVCHFFHAGLLRYFALRAPGASVARQSGIAPARGAGDRSDSAPQPVASLGLL